MSIPSLNKTQGEARKPLSPLGLWIKSVIWKALRVHSNVQVWRKDDGAVKMETKDKELMLGGGYRSYTDGLQGFSLYFIQVAWKHAKARLLSKLGKEICQVRLGKKTETGAVKTKYGYSNTSETMPNNLPEGQFDKWGPSEYLDPPHHHPHNNRHLWWNYNCYRLFVVKTRWWICGKHCARHCFTHVFVILLY